jgi:hypothetical protein
MHTGRAGGYDNSVEFLLADGFTDFFLSRVGAGVTVLFNVNHVWDGFGEFRDCMDIYSACDV